MANKLRIVSNNAADRATLSATTTAGSLVVANLQNDYKSDVYRSTATSATITATWSATETIGMVALPFCNLTSTATIRVKLYTNTADVSPVYDTGALNAGASVPTTAYDWGNTPLGVNSYSYVGAAYARLWFTQTPCKKMEVIISDASNTSGYIEAGRLVCGAYFTPTMDAELDVSWETIDTSISERSEASDLISSLGVRSRKMSFSLQNMTPADRLAIINIFKSNSTTRPLFVSLFPDDADVDQERLYQIYGKMSKTNAVTIAYWNAYATTIEIEEA